jgi:hypothetical protein
MPQHVCPELKFETVHGARQGRHHHARVVDEPIEMRQLVTEPRRARAYARQIGKVEFANRYLIW